MTELPADRDSLSFFFERFPRSLSCVVFVEETVVRWIARGQASLIRASSEPDHLFLLQGYRSVQICC